MVYYLLNLIVSVAKILQGGRLHRKGRPFDWNTTTLHRIAYMENVVKDLWAIENTNYSRSKMWKTGKPLGILALRNENVTPQYRYEGRKTSVQRLNDISAEGILPNYHGRINKFVRTPPTARWQQVGYLIKMLIPAEYISPTNVGMGNPKEKNCIGSKKVVFFAVFLNFYKRISFDILITNEQI